MLRRLIVAVMLAGLAGAACGCTYVGNRGADLADVFMVDLLAGPGLDARVQATGFLGTGLGSSKQWGMMMHGRHLGLGSRESGGFLLSASTDVTDDAMLPIYGDEEYEERSRSWLLLVRFPPIRPLIKSEEWPHMLDVEAGVSVLVIGTHVGVSPLELVDFVLGFTTIDLWGDDYEPEPEPPPAPAPVPSESPPAPAEPAAGAPETE